jgi:hypothetical protein
MGSVKVICRCDEEIQQKYQPISNHSMIRNYVKNVEKLKKIPTTAVDRIMNIVFGRGPEVMSLNTSDGS